MPINVVERRRGWCAAQCPGGLAPALSPRLALRLLKGRRLILERGEGRPGTSLRLPHGYP